MAISTIDNNGANLGQLGNRSLIINGAMVFDQRNGASAISSLGQYTTYTLDRWQYYSDQAGKFSFQQNQSSVTPPVGFTKYLGLTSLSAYSPGTNETVSISQHVEGFNSAQLNWGTSNAKTVSLSFWVRSSLTGTFSGVLAGGQNYIYTYDISSANTWEYKTITINGSTTGTWNTGNTSGIRVLFTLGYGSGQVGTANAWQSADFATAGAVQVVGTSGATFQITGVQLEVGDTATPFEHRSYGEELAKCQRYYWQSTTAAGYYAFQYASTHKIMPIQHPVEMRATPTATIVYASSSMTPFQADTLQFKAYLSSAYTDTSAYHMSSAKFDAEL
tara:strand:+ start:260 stop:1255 length:996 start_codon:yes stop_codon:yes gene_type:complete